MRTDLLADGVQCELSTDYHHLVLRNYLCVRRLAALNGIAVPPEMDALMRKGLEFSLYTHKPDGSIPSLSDGDGGSFLDLLELGSDLYGCPALRYAASRGREGTPPAYRSKGFAKSGYFILRSGWGEREERYEDERYLIFDCGPLGAGNHGHFDLLSFEMAAYGQSLIVDPGRYTYNESGEINWRVLFRGTAYHNTVLVDGKNQTRYLPGKYKFKIQGPEPERELKTFVSEPGFDYLHGIARSHEYPVTHERKVFFVCPEYWIVSDLLLANEQHDYELRYHLSPLAESKVATEVRHRTVIVDSPHLVLAQPFHPEIKLLVERGYISRNYGIKHESPIVNFARRAADACYHTVIFPYKYEKPEISLEKLPVRRVNERCSDLQASALRIEIVAGGRRYTDYYFIRHEDIGGKLAFADFNCQDALCFVRTDGENDILSRYSL